MPIAVVALLAFSRDKIRGTPNGTVEGAEAATADVREGAAGAVTGTQHGDSEAPTVMRNSIGMKLALIPAGEFIMGSDDGELDEKPLHIVRITRPFYLGHPAARPPTS